MKNIILTPEQLESLLEGEKVEGFEDFSAEANTDEGDYDAEKGAMYDFPIILTNEKTGETYQANTGYYTGPSGYHFYEDTEFEFVNPSEKYYLIKLSDNWADEFDVESFKVMSEEDYDEALKQTKAALKKIFKVPEKTFTEEEFKDMTKYNSYFTIDGKYQRLTYEKYLENPLKYNGVLVPKSYEIGFGTNEALEYTSEEAYWNSIEIEEITKEQRNTIVDLLGDEFGTCRYFFPIEYYGDEDEDEDDEE